MSAGSASKGGRASDAAVVGAGVVGRLVALLLTREGMHVSLFDKGLLTKRDQDEAPPCSYVAAGMLSPLAEALDGDATIYDLGRDSATRWEQIAATLPWPVPVSQRGAIAVASVTDTVELDDLRARALRRAPTAQIECLDHAALRELEPALADDRRSGLLLVGEGQIDNWAAMEGLGRALSEHPGRVETILGERVQSVSPRSVTLANGSKRTFGTVIDCRGMGAREDLRDLRGVRGELVVLHAPEVRLSRPVRVMHQRHPVYAVPRGDGRIIIGATCIESEAAGPPTVTAVLELLSAVYGLHAGFRHARVEHLMAGVRPAFPDNLPRVRVEPGLVRVNGLYRHGWLLAPLAAVAAVSVVLERPLESRALELVERA